MQDARSFDPAPRTLLPRYRRETGAATAAQFGTRLQAALDALARAGRDPSARAAALDDYQDVAAEAWRSYHQRVVADLDAPITHRLWRRWDALHVDDTPSALDLPETPPHVRERIYAQQRAWRQRSGALRWLLRDLDAGLGPLADRRPNLRILDLACGPGDLTAALAHWARRRKLQLELIAADRDEVALAMTREQLQGLGASVELRQVDPHDLSALASGAVDVVVAWGLLHRLRPEKIARLLVEAQRVAPHGIYLLDMERNPALPGLSRALMPLLYDEAMAREVMHSARVAWSRPDLQLLASLTQVPGLRARRVPPLWTALDNLTA